MLRREGVFDDLMEIGLELPWRVGFVRHTRGQPHNPIATLSWRDFERRVDEAFRRQGFTVTGFGRKRSGFGRNGPDGGVDLGLTKNGERFLVHCKHWRKRHIGVTVVRELQDIMSAHGAHGGFVLTGGEFTSEARDTADSCNITLVDGAALEELIGNHTSKIR